MARNIKRLHDGRNSTYTIYDCRDRVMNGRKRIYSPLLVHVAIQYYNIDEYFSAFDTCGNFLLFPMKRCLCLFTFFFPSPLTLTSTTFSKTVFFCLFWPEKIHFLLKGYQFLHFYEAIFQKRTIQNQSAEILCLKHQTELLFIWIRIN